MIFFVVPWLIFIIGVGISVLADRHALRRTAPRIVEIALLWTVVWFAAWGLIGVFGHLGPNSVDIAESIGYAPSMFPREVGFGDLALCALGIGSDWFPDRRMPSCVAPDPQHNIAEKPSEHGLNQHLPGCGRSHATRV